MVSAAQSQKTGSKLNGIDAFLKAFDILPAKKARESTNTFGANLAEHSAKLADTPAIKTAVFSADKQKENHSDMALNIDVDNSEILQQIAASLANNALLRKDMKTRLPENHAALPPNISQAFTSDAGKSAAAIVQKLPANKDSKTAESLVAVFPDDDANIRLTAKKDATLQLNNTDKLSLRPAEIFSSLDTILAICAVNEDDSVRGKLTKDTLAAVNDKILSLSEPQLQELALSLIQQINNGKAAHDAAHTTAGNPKTRMTGSVDDTAVPAPLSNESTRATRQHSATHKESELLHSVMTALQQQLIPGAASSKDIAAETPTDRGPLFESKSTEPSMTDNKKIPESNTPRPAVVEKENETGEALSAYISQIISNLQGNSAIQSDRNFGAGSVKAKNIGDHTVADNKPPHFKTAAHQFQSISAGSAKTPENQLYSGAELSSPEAAFRFNVSHRTKDFEQAQIKTGSETDAAAETNQPRGAAIDARQKIESNNFIAKVHDILKSKGHRPESITRMISEVTIPKVAESGKAANLSAESLSPLTDTMSNAVSNSHGKDDAHRIVLSTESEKHAALKNAPMNTTEDGNSFGHKISQDMKPAVQSLKQNDVESFEPHFRTVDSIPSTFYSDFKATSKVEPQAIKIQSIIDQIAAAKQQMDADFGRVKIVLNPPELGTVDMEVIVRQNRVEVILTSDQPSVQQLLTAHSDEVKSALQKHDLKIENFQVLLQSDQQGNQHQSNHWTFMNGHNPKKSSYTMISEDAGDQPSIMRSNSTAPAQGLVSIFV